MNNFSNISKNRCNFCGNLVQYSYINHYEKGCFNEPKRSNNEKITTV